MLDRQTWPVATRAKARASRRADGEGRDRTTVGAHRREPPDRSRWPPAAPPSPRPHHRMLRLHRNRVRSRRSPPRPCSAAGQAEKAGVLARAVVVQRRGRFARAQRARAPAVSSAGQCVPFETPGVELALASMPRAVATCAGSPLCEAQASASSASASFSASAAPLATSGSACSNRRAREYGALGDLAERAARAAVAIDDRHRAAVRRFQRAAAALRPTEDSSSSSSQQSLMTLPTPSTTPERLTPSASARPPASWWRGCR